MNKADYLAIAAFVLITAGVALVYRPAAFIVAGIVCLLLARASAQPAKPRPDAEN